ncbi:hypothetical protein SAMN05443572_109327 [Myxococcus fulvus]|uniref:Lipoprotein n=2 Tax=Myxococcus fulvus TaxID=33 RepID=A0A511T686_MYXFU|nr:hypothetical protein MFU01_47120 [Myxococcus fulvus]SEU33615.1 hypothetical protein SAMN05443572_109327 [Myxococcus fulvus]
MRMTRTWNRALWWTCCAAMVWTLGCKGGGEEQRRDAASAPETAPATEARASAEVPKSEERPRVAEPEVDAGPTVCPEGQYPCCDGSCGDSKGCPGIACDPRRMPPTMTK